MTRKHFEAIAAIIKATRIPGESSPGFDNGYETATENIASSLASYFASQNERFDRERFLKACGFDA